MKNNIISYYAEVMCTCIVAFMCKLNVRKYPILVEDKCFTPILLLLFRTALRVIEKPCIF